EVAHAVLMMNRERLVRFAGDNLRAAADVEELAPAARRFVESTNAAPGDGQRPKGADFRRIEGASRCRRQGYRALERFARLTIHSGACEYLSQRERFPRGARFGRTGAREMKQARCERREREQIEPIVLEDGNERLDVPGAHELEVARRDLESVDVRHSSRADDVLLERRQRTIAQI